MKKDFTKANEEKLISIVKQVTADGFFEKIGDFFGDIGLTISGWFGNLNINNYVDSMDEYYRKVLDKNNTTVAKIKRIFNTVREDDAVYARRQANNRNVYMEPVTSYLKELISCIDTDNNSISISPFPFRLNQLRALLRENKIRVVDNPAYSNDVGYYGGKQHGCIERWLNEETAVKQQIIEIMHKYFPEYTEADIQTFLDEMNHHGCHYMAVVNTIFAQYVGREELFEKTFGFPMYDENGHVNSDLLMLDFYARQNAKDGEHSSLGYYEINSQWQDYLRDKGVKVEVKHINLDIDDFYTQAEKGEIIIGYSPLRLRDRNGNLVDNRDGGHATVIIGVETINGKKMYKVSSWGKEYWIDPDDFKEFRGQPKYEQVIYQ